MTAVKSVSVSLSASFVAIEEVEAEREAKALDSAPWRRNTCLCLPLILREPLVSDGTALTKRRAISAPAVGPVADSEAAAPAAMPLRKPRRGVPECLRHMSSFRDVRVECLDDTRADEAAERNTPRQKGSGHLYYCGAPLGRGFFRVHTVMSKAVSVSLRRQVTALLAAGPPTPGAR